YVKDIVEDGVKIGIGFFWKPLFEKIKKLFKKNEEYRPDIELVKLTFNDLEIIIYPIYKNSIAENINDIIQKLSENYVYLKKEVDSKIISIHIPIFNQTDIYEICNYRVKLNVDENIPGFFKEDYFKLWGIRCDSGKDFVFDLRGQK